MLGKFFKNLDNLTEKVYNTFWIQPKCLVYFLKLRKEGAYVNCNFLRNYDRPTDRPTQRKEGAKVSFTFQKETALHSLRSLIRECKTMVSPNRVSPHFPHTCTTNNQSIFQPRLD